jgi:phage I-like protein
MAKTQAQTPAPKKDRIEGSKANPKGSASGSRGGIKISDQAVKSLENMRDKHNDRYNAKHKQVDLGTLKAVFRRGAGAFSVSHRPGMDRTQWALARVRTFLKLVGTGERKKAYNTDLDLLPKGHPQRTEKEAKAEQLAPKKYSHIDFTPPQGAREAAKRALEVRADKPSSQKGMTPVGIARARDLMNGKALSPDTVKRMLAYFTRHEIDKKGSTWNIQGKGWQAWQGWGGDAGFAWARKIVKQMKSADEKSTALRAYGEAVQIQFSEPSFDVPEGLTIGRPFKTLALGQVSSRMSGDSIGKAIDHDLLQEMVRVFNERKQNDPVIIDWQHATSPFQGGTPAPPESGNALGLIVELELREDGLYATPAYNERGLEVVKNAGGVLWSSPEFLNGEVYSRDGGAKIGNAQLLAITLTPRPAQSHDKIERVTLNERTALMDNISEMSVEELRQMLVAKDEMVKELEQKIKDMMTESEASMNKEEDDKEMMAEEEEKIEEEKEIKIELEEEKKDYKMSEQLTESTLLNEVQALRENNAKLSERLEKIEAEKREIERNDAVKTLLNEGRVSPSEASVVGKAWELRDIQPEFWKMFSERPMNSTIPLTTVGHGASGEEISKATLDLKIRETAKEKSISYSEALSYIQKNDTDFYTKAMEA